MKGTLHLSTLPALAGAIWAIFHYGLPDKPTVASITMSDYAVEFACAALLALSASIFVALRRMRP